MYKEYIMSLNYIRYGLKEQVSALLGTVTWMGLTTFMIVSKNSIGVNNIPIFELMIFVASLISVHATYKYAVVPYKLLVFIRLMVAVVFLVSLYYVLETYTVAEAGIVVYGVIIVNAGMSYFEGESKQYIEHEVLTKQVLKKYLKDIRELSNKLKLVGGAVGSSVAIVSLTYFGVDLIVYTKVILILNVIAVVYELYIWNKYLR